MDKLTVLNPNYPLWMNWNIAKVHFIRHEYPETITWLERAGSETWHWTHAYIAAALCAQGEIERGKASIERALQIMPNLAEVYWPETHMWFKGDGVYPLMDIVGSGLIPTVIDQNPCAHLRMPRDMIFHGWSMRLFQAWQHSATMSS